VSGIIVTSYFECEKAQQDAHFFSLIFSN